jgi:hypothetical protein
MAVFLLAVEPAAAQTSEGARPDFSGIWFPSGGARQSPQPLPLTEGAKRLAAEYEAQFVTDDDPGRFCIWPGMPRAPWGAPFPIEIIHRPQDVTIYWEGYGMYRKIYMSDSAPPPPPVPSAMGHSVADWDGDTLVVETTNLKAYPYMSRLATTSDAHVMERLTMTEREVNGERRKVLVDEITLTDPKMYSEPVQIRAEAQLRPDMQMLEYTCTDTLWDDYLLERGLTLPDVDALPEPQ